MNEYSEELIAAIQGESIPADSPPAGEEPATPSEPEAPAPEAPSDVAPEVTTDEAAEKPETPADEIPEGAQTIPVERMKQVIDQRNQTREEVAQLKEQLQKSEGGQQVLDALLTSDPSTWREAVRRGIVPQEVLTELVAAQAPQAPVAPQPEADPWAEDSPAGLTAAQAAELARQKALEVNQPLQQAVQQLMADRVRSQLKEKYGDAYDPKRDDPLMRQISFQHPTLDAEAAFHLTRTYVAPPAGPPPPDPSRAKVTKPASSGRPTQSTRKQDALAAKERKFAQARGLDQVNALADLLHDSE